MRRSSHRLARKILLAAVALTVVPAAGCSDDPAVGTLVLHLSDAPFPFDMVASTEVAIDSVAVRVGGTADNEGGFHTVARTPRTVDLLELRNGVTLELGSSEVPAGEVDQVRVYTGDATVTLADDRTFPLKFPSGSSSGVKVFVDPPIVIGDGETVEALIDYDLGRSFSSVPGSPGRIDDITSFSFHPVLRVTNLVDAGGVSGTVLDDAGTPGDPADDVPLAGAAVTVTQGTTEVTGTASAADGRWVLLGLPPGGYTVTASHAGYVAASAPVTIVAAREAADVDLLLNAVP